MRPWISEEDKKAVEAVLDSGWLTEGEVVKKFEKAIADYVGVKHAVAVPNATIGLQLVCFHLASRECYPLYVSVPSFTHPATGAVGALADFRFVIVRLCDVDINTKTVGTRHIVKHSDLVFPVSWGGYPVDPAIYDYSHSCTVVEDAACGLGAKYNSVHTGRNARAAVFSFHPRKLITTGEGGVVTTNDNRLAATLRTLKSFGYEDDTFHPRGFNFKMSNINAALGLSQLNRIEHIIDERIKMAMFYNDMFEDVAGIETPYHGPHVRETFQTYAVRVKNRDKLIDRMKKKGIETQIGTYDLQSLPAFKIGDELPYSRILGEELLSLPLHHYLSEDDQHTVVEVLINELET